MVYSDLRRSTRVQGCRILLCRICTHIRVEALLRHCTEHGSSPCRAVCGKAAPTSDRYESLHISNLCGCIEVVGGFVEQQEVGL